MQIDLSEKQQAIWSRVASDLADEPVASIDHVERMTTWCKKIGASAGADMETLIAGGLLHDVGVVIDRKSHYQVGRERAAQILRETGYPEEKIESVLHVLEAHSRYGGPEPQSKEAKVGQDADALEYIGAIGVLRAVVRGLKDGSFDGKISGFPDFIRTILAKVEGTFHTEVAEQIGRSRVAFMKVFLERVEKELKFEA